MGTKRPRDYIAKMTEFISEREAQPGGGRGLGWGGGRGKCWEGATGTKGHLSQVSLRIDTDYDPK